ncbi:hypothetical protein BDV19DRAFT_387042 [Aspergillus venezuelensis]
MAANAPFPAHPYPRNKRPPKREKEMKVLCLGMSRTGTLSLTTALNKLGYRTYHTSEACLQYRNASLETWNRLINYKYHRGHRNRTNRAKKPTKADFDTLLAPYDAVADIPAILFPNELMDLYPNAKIILTVRDDDIPGWIKSMRRSYFAILAMKRLWILAWFDSHYLRPALDLLSSAVEIFVDGGNPLDKGRLVAGYEAHNAHIRGLARRKGRRVLVYDVKSGWWPLCEFLGRDIPRVNGVVMEFPWKSERGFMRGLHCIIGWWRGVVLLGIVVGILLGYGVGKGVLWWVYVSRQRW